MTHSITAMFDDHAAAERAVRRLKAANFADSEISLIAGRRDSTTSSTAAQARDRDDDNDAGTGATLGGLLGGGAGLLAGIGSLAIPGLGPVVAAGWLASTLVGATAGAVTGGLIGAMTDAGIPESEAHGYAEGIRRGGTLVSVRAPDSRVDEAIDILDDEGTVDMDERTREWRSQGWDGRFSGESTATAAPIAAATTGSMASPRPTSVPPSGTTAGTADEEARIPIVEEQLDVGKRQHERRVRVHTRTIEEPVEKTVHLHDERVVVERRPASGPADMTEDPNRVIEVVERTEEPVVNKRAHVTEEVVLRKESQERTETVRDTVKHTEVEVDDQRASDTSPERRSS